MFTCSVCVINDSWCIGGTTGYGGINIGNILVYILIIIVIEVIIQFASKRHKISVFAQSVFVAIVMIVISYFFYTMHSFGGCHICNSVYDCVEVNRRYVEEDKKYKATYVCKWTDGEKVYEGIECEFYLNNKKEN